MKRFVCLLLLFSLCVSAQDDTQTNDNPDAKMLRSIYDLSLTEGQCYENLNDLCCNIGGRLSGSKEAEMAVEWAKKKLEGFADTVFLQPVMVPHWVRGEAEEAEILFSDGSVVETHICALGFSIATPAEGLTAEVVEVFSLEEVAQLKPEEVEGKIVLFNRPMDPKHIDTFHAYSGCVDQRSSGASEAAPHGAAAVLVRSMNLRQDDLPHTGVQRYKDGVKKIPSAAISTNGASFLSEALKIDPKLKVRIKMNCQNFPDVLSYNVIADIKGSKYPDELLMVSGHLDSWDTGEGAHDDGAGTVHAMEVLRMMKVMKYEPEHTIRCVLYMNEENGPNGAIEYAKVTKELGWNHRMALESDRGGFSPRGFTFDGMDDVPDKMLATVSQWKGLFEPFHIHIFDKGFGGVDIGLMRDQGVPLIGFLPDPQRYFDYHHAPNDNMDAVNERELELGAAAIMSLVYLLDQHLEEEGR